MTWILEMAENKPFILILDEFQTWFEGLTNSNQYKRKVPAFNFIQILSEISAKYPGTSDTCRICARSGNLRRSAAAVPCEPRTD